MSTEHAPQAATDPGVHDHATEVKHAWEHFRENAYFFAGFLSLVLCAVLQFEVSPGHNFYWIFALGAARFALIGPSRSSSAPFFSPSYFSPGWFSSPCGIPR
jgi:hypothetical protein